MSRFIFLFAASILLLPACTKDIPYFENNGIVYNTSYHIIYQSPAMLTEKIDAELTAFNNSLNPFNPNSIISKVNRNEPVEVDDWFITVFNKSMYISEMTNGIFDVTCAPLINIWGFGFREMENVSPAAIDSIKEFVGYKKVRIEGNRVVKDDPRLLLNCSAICKGYACDVIAGVLEQNGVTNYMVEIGGECTIKGVNEKGQPWQVGIRKPEEVNREKSVTIEEVIQLRKKGGIASSGDYQNFYLKDGKKYAHTINPITGYPAEQNILSCTIVSDSCMIADGFATAFTAIGLEEACRIADSLPEIEYYFIYTDETGDYKIAFSEGMLKYLPGRKKAISGKTR